MKLKHIGSGQVFENEEMARRDYAVQQFKINPLSAYASLDPEDPGLLIKLIATGLYEEYIDPVPTQEELDKIAASNLANNIESIWQAANVYVEAQISGAAYGMVATLITLHKLDQNVGTKGVAVKEWIDSVWTQYYTNKYMLKAGIPFDNAMLDYSSKGDMPHDVPELKAELDAIGF